MCTFWKNKLSHGLYWRIVMVIEYYMKQIMIMIVKAVIKNKQTKMHGASGSDLNAS